VNVTVLPKVVALVLALRIMLPDTSGAGAGVVGSSPQPTNASAASANAKNFVSLIVLKGFNL
jgi:hypothetical protein